MALLNEYGVNPQWDNMVLPYGMSRVLAIIHETLVPMTQARSQPVASRKDTTLIFYRKDCTCMCFGLPRSAIGKPTASILQYTPSDCSFQQTQISFRAPVGTSEHWTFSQTSAVWSRKPTNVCAQHSTQANLRERISAAIYSFTRTSSCSAKKAWTTFEGRCGTATARCDSKGRSAPSSKNIDAKNAQADSKRGNRSSRIRGYSALGDCWAFGT